jgi:hypothetical protein
MQREKLSVTLNLEGLISLENVIQHEQSDIDRGRGRA